MKEDEKKRTDFKAGRQVGVSFVLFLSLVTEKRYKWNFIFPRKRHKRPW